MAWDALLSTIVTMAEDAHRIWQWDIIWPCPTIDAAPFRYIAVFGRLEHQAAATFWASHFFAPLTFLINIALSDCGYGIARASLMIRILAASSGALSTSLRTLAMGGIFVAG